MRRRKQVKDGLVGQSECCSSFDTYHHVEMECVLGLKVLQLHQNGKDGLLPHFDDDHLMNQNRDLDGGKNTSCTFVRWEGLI